MGARRPKTVPLHLMHASLLAGSDSTRADCEFIFSKGAHVVSFTELYGGNLAPMRREARQADYTAVTFPGAIGEGFAISNTKGLRLKDKGSVKVHDASGGLPKRCINWIKFEFEGADVYHHVGHWLAHLNDGQGRLKRHNEMTERMVALVKKHGQGRDVAFFAGDVNEDDKATEDRLLGNMNTVFPRAGLLTIWDERGVYPGTFGPHRTIDVIGSYDKDGRVKADRYKVWSKQGSDHRFVSAWYTTQLERKRVRNDPVRR